MVEPRTNQSHSEVRIVPTKDEEVPDIVTCELLAFSGAFPPYELLACLMRPTRAPLVRTGVHPRHWPGFATRVRQRTLNLHDGSIFFTALVIDEEGKEVVAGAAWMTPPKDLFKISQQQKLWTERLLYNVAYPLFENVRSKLSDDIDGTDTLLFSILKRKVELCRDRVDPERIAFIINMLYVHPSFHRRGIGSALLEKCSSVSDAEGRPLLLESTTAGIPLYAARNFTQVDAVEINYVGEHIVMPAMIRQPVRTQTNKAEACDS